MNYGNDKITLIYDLENENGFFCNFFFLFSTYIFSRKNSKMLFIKDNNWKFKYKNGLSDYFEKNAYYQIIHDVSYIENPNIFRHSNEVITKLYYQDYRKYIREFYLLNNEVLQCTNNYKARINLPEKYNSIFVRGGDKLIYESQYIPCEIYIKKLLEIHNNNTNLFIHSDDHDEVMKFIGYIKTITDKFNIFYITDEIDKGGALVMERLRYGIKNKNKKSVDQMNDEEIKLHVFKMLSAVEIMRNSENVILDYQSNVSRFMKLYFDCPIHNVMEKMDMIENTLICNPAYEQSWLPPVATNVTSDIFYSFNGKIHI